MEEKKEDDQNEQEISIRENQIKKSSLLSVLLGRCSVNNLDADEI